MDIPSLYQSVFNRTQSGQELANIYARTAKVDIEANWLIRMSEPVTQLMIYHRVYTSAVDACLWFNDVLHKHLKELHYPLYVSPDVDYITIQSMKGLRVLLMDEPDFVLNLRSQCLANLTNAIPSQDAVFLRPFAKITI